MEKFIKKADLQLINGGYLSHKDETPVTNTTFVAAQRRAEFIVEFAKACKGKTFKDTPGASLDAVRAEVMAKLEGAAKKEFFDMPKKTVSDITEKLKKEALAFTKNQEEIGTVSRLNEFMQEFNIINEFEEYGLFFGQGIVKLNKIYTIKDIQESLKEVIDLL